MKLLLLLTPLLPVHLRYAPDEELVRYIDYMISVSYFFRLMIKVQQLSLLFYCYLINRYTYNNNKIIFIINVRLLLFVKLAHSIQYLTLP